MLCITRHGETTWNAQGLVYGRADASLTGKGRVQTQKLAEKIVDLSVLITKIIHSPPQRVRDIAQAVVDRLNLPLTAGGRSVEMDFGGYDELPDKDENF